MNIPNIWGQGQIFAFSALDGKTSRITDFSGTLSGDRVGVRFNSKKRRELAIVGFEADDLVFRAVCGDYIHGIAPAGNIRILFHAAHLIIGEVPEGGVATVFTEGTHKIEMLENIEVQDSLDGEYTALYMRGRRFAFAYGSTPEEVRRLVREGIAEDLSEAEEKKLAFYREHSIEGEYAGLYSKCLSVMRTQLFTPEAMYDMIWSTPDRLPHQDLFLWDSVFHGIGFRHVDGRIAEDVILAIFANQKENGMIPCRVKLTADGVTTSTESQPPVIAWGAWNVYKKTGNRVFLKKVLEENRKFLEWCRQNRMYSDGLYAWYVDENYLICKCGESGMDNSPRFDNVKHLLAIDYSCFMANEMRHMAKIAEELGEDATGFEAEFEMLKKAINSVLWDEETGCYFDYDADRKQLHKVKSIASFLALFAGVCEGERAERLVSHLKNPAEFCTEFPIPTVSVDDATFGSDMWRGPVWLNFNYMICEGLKETGYGTLAAEITEKTLQILQEWYEKTGVIFEFYDSENKRAPFSLRRKGDPVEPYDMRIRVQTIRDFGWSCCLTLDMIANA